MNENAQNELLELEREAQIEEKEDIVITLQRENSELQREMRRIIEEKKTLPKQEKKDLSFSENHILADLQQRLIKLEYEFLEIRTKLFSPSVANPEQRKLSPLGKSFRRDLRR